ncbi:MAG: hypothetical protein GY719_05600 [bacterium]|nr:hypothetical protein [bacterium]
MSWTLILSILVALVALAWALTLLGRLRAERQRFAEALRSAEDRTSGADAAAADLAKAIEERDRLARALEAKGAEMATKDEEMDRFVYTVSHDLKSPLITIQGFLGLLEQDAAAGDVERTKRDADRIRGAVDVMKGLLEDLLELSRIGRMVNPPEEVGWTVLAEEAATRVAAERPDHGVEIEIAPDLPTVVGDRFRLLQAMQHLVENAVKFTAGVDDPKVEVGAEVNGDETVCRVRDNGIGIDPRFHTKIFGLFDQLASDTGGTGIGLTLAERIAAIHGGRVWVESEGEGEGSTFYFALPLPAH